MMSGRLLALTHRYPTRSAALGIRRPKNPAMKSYAHRRLPVLDSADGDVNLDGEAQQGAFLCLLFVA